MKHINLYEDHDLLRDLTKLGINEIKWDVDTDRSSDTTPIAKLEAYEEDHEIANNWNYKNLRFVEIEGDYGYKIRTDSNNISDTAYYFELTFNSDRNKLSVNSLVALVRINTAGDDTGTYIIISKGNRSSNETVVKTFDFNTELIDGYGKNPIFPYILKTIEKLL